MQRNTWFLKYNFFVHVANQVPIDHCLKFPIFINWWLNISCDFDCCWCDWYYRLSFFFHFFFCKVSLSPFFLWFSSSFWKPVVLISSRFWLNMIQHQPNNNFILVNKRGSGGCLHYFQVFSLIDRNLFFFLSMIRRQIFYINFS